MLSGFVNHIVFQVITSLVLMSGLALLDIILFYTPAIISFCFLVYNVFFTGKHNRSMVWLNLTLFCSFVTFIATFVYQKFDSFHGLFTNAFVFPIIISMITFRYFYTLSLIREFKFKKKHIVHFIPAILMFVALLILFLLMNDEQRIYYYSCYSDYACLIKNPASVVRITAIIGVLGFQCILLVQLFIYTFKVLRIIKEHQNYLKNNFSYTSSIDLNWLKNFTIFILFTKFFGIVLLVISYNGVTNRIILNSLLSVGVFYFCIFGVKQKAIDVPNPIGQDTNGDTGKILADCDNSQTTKTVNTDLKQDLLDYFNFKKPYLNAELKMDDLILYLNSNRSYVSRIINEEFELNFYAFVNKYRVEYAKILLMDEAYSHYSIKAISEMSGFKSVSSFYSFFKQFEHTTPSIYQQMRFNQDKNGDL